MTVDPSVPGPRVERLSAPLVPGGASAPTLAPLRVERLAPSPAPRSTAPAPEAAPRPQEKIAAEILELVFEPASLADPTVRERFEAAHALALSAPDPRGNDRRTLLRVPRPSWATRRRRPVELPPGGPESSFPTSTERPADWTILAANPPRPVAFGETAPSAPDWERWVATPGTTLVRVSLRGTMIAATAEPGPPRYLESPEMLLWGRGRAVLVAAPESRDAWLGALEAFAFLEGHLARLEKETAASFARDAEALSAYLLPVDSGSQSRGEELQGAHAVTVARLRREFALLEPVLGDPPQELPAHAKRLFELLAENHGIDLRLEALDDRIEVLEDQSEIVGGRLLELGVARRELKVEWLIVLILALELVGVGFESYLMLAAHRREQQASRNGD